MSINEFENEEEKINININNNKKEIAPSSLKNNKFKGLTSEEIIKKYEEVLFSREKQFYELSNEITKLTQTIQNLVEKKNKSKYNNDKLKEVLENDEKILKQELSNKEIVFMKLTDLEHKYDDLQNKIDDIINKQNALAESKENEGNEEIKKLINKSPEKIIEDNNSNSDENEENIPVKDEIKEKTEKKEGMIIMSEEKNDIKEEEKIENNKSDKKEKYEKKENKYVSARERLNRLKEKKEKVQKLNLSEFINQSNNNNNA